MTGILHEAISSIMIPRWILFGIRNASNLYRKSKYISYFSKFRGPCIVTYRLSSFWGATTSGKSWSSQLVSSIRSGLWCSPSSLLFSSLLCRSLHHPPIYFLVFLAIFLVWVTTHILLLPCCYLPYDVRVRTKLIFGLWYDLWYFIAHQAV